MPKARWEDSTSSGLLMCSSNVPASFSAFTASFCTVSAMIMVIGMLRAFVSAGFTDGSTYSGQLRYKGRIAGNCLLQKGADVRTFPVQANALDHHLDIIFLKTSVETVVAGSCTIMQNLNKFLMLSLCHVKTSIAI